MSDAKPEDREAEALYHQDDLTRLDGTVLRVMASFASVELPEPWAAASFALPEEGLAVGDAVGVAGREDAKLATGTRRGFLVLALRWGPAESPRYLRIDHAEGPAG